jgi:hypothetical protein
VGLIDEDMIHTNFIKMNAVILLVLGEQVLETLSAGAQNQPVMGA